jgi:hypothetical protein
MQNNAIVVSVAVQKQVLLFHRHLEHQNEQVRAFVKIRFNVCEL